MSLSTTFASLSLDLARPLPRNTRPFAEARARRPELAPFPTIPALLDTLTSSPPTSPAAVDARRSLLAALVAEAQSETPSFASAALVLAFAPMLLRLRRHFGPRRDDDDFDSTVLLAFTRAVRTVSAGPYTALALRWATQHVLLAVRRAERRHARHAPFDEGMHSPEPFAPSQAQTLIEEAIHALEKKGMADLLDAVIATRGHNESLRDYVARVHTSPREQQARYGALLRARRQFELELRRRLLDRAA